MSITKLDDNIKTLHNLIKDLERDPDENAAKIEDLKARKSALIRLLQDNLRRKMK